MVGRPSHQSQSESYLTTIKKQLWLLTQQPLMGTERSELLPDSRSLPIESHTLFYRVTVNRVEIIRVLHGRQDPQRHLK
ncbi:MAG: type II toxin-antitoxin system RelE/ParE family toxin [Candidatus Thiodiazotropha sp. 6PLUC7]